MNFLKEEDYKKRFDFFVKKRFDFWEVETKKKRYLKKGKMKFYLKTSEEDKPIPLPSLGLISKGKNNIIKNFEAGKQDRFNFPNNTKLDLFQCINKLYTKTYDNKTGEIQTSFRKWEGEATAIDLSAAYITQAMLMGLLDKHIYNQFFEQERRKYERIKKSKIKEFCGHNGEVYKHSKRIRLITLGALAQYKSIKKYIGGEFKETEVKYNEEQANIFFTVSAEVGKLMIEVLEKFNGFFSYVDCIFVPRDKEEEARAFLKSKGFDTNIKRGYLVQDGKNFSFFNEKNGAETKYNISAGKRPSILKRIYDRNFIKDLAKEYQEGLKEFKSEEQKEKLRKGVSEMLVQRFKLESVKDLNLRFLQRELKKHHLVLSDIIQIKLTIEETHKDLIFGEILDFIILDKIIKEEEIEKQVLPALEETIDINPEKADLITGKRIERDFKIDFN